MNKLIKERYKQYNEKQFIKIIKKKKQKTDKLYAKFKKHDLILSELLTEYRWRYMY